MGKVAWRCGDGGGVAVVAWRCDGGEGGGGRIDRSSGVVMKMVKVAGEWHKGGGGVERVVVVPWWRRRRIMVVEVLVVC